MPTRNGTTPPTGRQLPARSSFRPQAPPDWDPSPISPFTTQRRATPTPEQLRENRRRDFSRLTWTCALAAILCAVAWSATQDAGYLVLALAATVTTVMVAAATIKE